jgi:hypothetical protein
VAEQSCRSCGKPIESDARFCPYCGKPQEEAAARPASTATSSSATTPAPGDPPAAARGRRLEDRLRQVFPRHHLQDEFMHVGTIAAGLIAVVGFILGFIAPVWPLGITWLLFAIAILLFLMLRESTLSHVRTRDREAASAQPPVRYQAGRTPGDRPAGDAGTTPGEAATAESSPRRKR